jgi:hypothetical protein
MLIVGTRGRSLGGFQGLVSNRNSFSKWCLQYSPIPVVVVRPTEKRLKKKKKRDADPARQDYARILKESGIAEHEMETVPKSSVFQEPNNANEEAHAVADALGLPDQFDPTKVSSRMYRAELPRRDRPGSRSASRDSLSPGSRSASPSMALKRPKSPLSESPTVSGDDSSEDDEEGEFEVVPGHTLLADEDEMPEYVKKQKLHEMEVGEAAALAAGRKPSVESQENSGGAAEDEEEGREEVADGFATPTL